MDVSSQNNRSTASLHSEGRWTGLREVMGMAGPIVLGTLSFTLMSFVDQAMVSQLGTDALAAIGASNLWAYILGCFLFGLIGCVGTFVAQSYGKSELEHCARYAWQGLYLALLSGGLILLLLPLSGPIFRLMGHSEAVTQLELTNFRVRVFGYIPLAWMTAVGSFFQSIGRPGIPTAVGMGANVVNLVLNYVLIFGHWGFPALGIAGSGLATVISLFAQAAVLQWIFMSREMHAAYQSRTVWRIDWRRMYELLRIGAPSGLMMFLDVANWGLFTSFVVGRFGDVPLAAHNAAMAFMQFCFMPALAVNQGISVIAGTYIGKRDFDRAASRTYTAMKATAVYMLVMGIVFAALGRGLIQIFFSDEPAVLDLGQKLLFLAAVFQGFDAVNIVTMGAMRGAGDTFWMAVLTLAGAYGLFLPLAIYLAIFQNMGAIGAWLGATVYIISLSGMLFARFYSGKWRNINIFIEER